MSCSETFIERHKYVLSVLCHDKVIPITLAASLAMYDLNYYIERVVPRLLKCIPCIKSHGDYLEWVCNDELCHSWTKSTSRDTRKSNNRDT